MIAINPELLRLIPGYDPFETAEEGHWFDQEAAEAACAFYVEYLTHTKGAKAKEPIDLEPWQASIIANTFGWKKANGFRVRSTTISLSYKDICRDDTPGKFYQCSAGHRKIGAKKSPWPTMWNGTGGFRQPFPGLAGYPRLEDFRERINPGLLSGPGYFKGALYGNRHLHLDSCR